MPHANSYLPAYMPYAYIIELYIFTHETLLFVITLYYHTVATPCHAASRDIIPRHCLRFVAVTSCHYHIYYLLSEHIIIYYWLHCLFFIAIHYLHCRRVINMATLLHDILLLHATLRHFHVTLRAYFMPRHHYHFACRRCCLHMFYRLRSGWLYYCCCLLTYDGIIIRRHICQALPLSFIIAPLMLVAILHNSKYHVINCIFSASHYHYAEYVYHYY